MRIRTKVSSILPEGYTQLEYIESVYPNQYLIDTGVLVSSTLVTEITLIPNENYLSENAIFGGDWTANGYFLMFYQNKIRFHSKNFVCDVSDFNKNGINIIKTYSKDLTDNILEINGVSYRYTHTAGGQTPDVSQNISIFKPTGNSYVSAKYGYFKLCNFKMYDNDVLIRNFVPALRESDNKIGLYDLVNNQFYTNSKTGEFLYKKKVDSFKVSYYKLSRLPNEYQKVEYIESTGTQYIDSGYVLTSENLKVLLKVYTNSVPGNEQDIISNNFRTTGDFTLGFYSRYVFAFNRNDENVISQTYTGSQLFDIEFIFDAGTHIKSLKVNGQMTTNSYSGKIKNDRNITIFKSPVSFPFSGRLYTCQIYDNDVLVRNFIPCYRKADGEIGFYDLVNNTFYTNQGTGTFLKGNDISNIIVFPCMPRLCASRLPSTYQEVEYIESHGTEWIDTQYFLQSNNLIIKTKIYTPEMPWNEQDIVSNQDSTNSRFVLGLFGNYVFAYNKEDQTSNTNVVSNTYSGSQTLDIEIKYDWLSKSKTLTVNTLSSSALYDRTIYPSNNPIRLFCDADTVAHGNTGFMFIGRTYNMMIYDNSTLVRNFIPCYRKSDNVIGLYDTVTNTFFTNQGTGTFTKGNNKNTII